MEFIHSLVLTVLYTAPYNTFPQKIGRFGITTVRGPPARPIDESVEQIYGIDLQGRHVSSAAIVYMVVDEKFRSRNVGTLALQVISTIHSIQGCDFTLLVADDDGSGKLVEWYEEHGFSQAPLLQDLLGSPGGQYGVAMMAPTSNVIDGACRIKWW
jgi:GNAT superfamily N-acetyltransferase